MPIWGLALQVAVSALTSVLPAVEAEITNAVASGADTAAHEIAQVAVKNALAMLNDLLSVANKVAASAKK